MTTRPQINPHFMPPALLGVTALAFLSLISPTPVLAQDMSAYTADSSAPAQQQAAPTYTPQQLDQMLAPIALYPDALVGQILMASTYPLEVVEAYRWQQNPSNAGLQGDQLTAALEQQPWDPSVKSLVAVPQLLKTLNDNLQWTEQLGDAFLAQQAAVMDSVQHLRQRAETAGTLSSTPQQTVATQGPDIVITPTDPDVVYVPTYNPMVVYGAWPYVGYPPYYFSGYNYYGNVIGFGVGFGIVGGLWGWNHWDWAHHHIDINDRRFGALNRGNVPSSNVWQHDPDHRRGVPYRDAGTRARFQGNASAETQRNYRGYGTAAPQANMNRQAYHPTAATNYARTQPNHAGFAQQQRSAVQMPNTAFREQAQAPRQVSQPAQMARPAPMTLQRPAAPVYESFSRGAEVQAQSARGAFSRSTMPAAAAQPHYAPAPQRAAAPAQQHAAPQGGGGGRGGNNERR